MPRPNYRGIVPAWHRLFYCSTHPPHRTGLTRNVNKQTRSWLYFSKAISNILSELREHHLEAQFTVLWPWDQSLPYLVLWRAFQRYTPALSSVWESRRDRETSTPERFYPVAYEDRTIIGRSSVMSADLVTQAGSCGVIHQAISTKLASFIQYQLKRTLPPHYLPFIQR